MYIFVTPQENGVNAPLSDFITCTYIQLYSELCTVPSNPVYWAVIMNVI